MNLKEAAKKSKNMFCVKDESNGFVFIGFYDELLKFVPLKKHLKTEIIDIYQINGATVLVCKGESFKKFKKYWDRQEFVGEKYKPNKNLNTEAVLNIRNAIFEMAYRDLIDELVSGGNAVKRFFKSGKFELNEEIGQEVLGKAKKDMEDTKKFIQDFIESHEKKVDVPDTINHLCLRRVVFKTENIGIRYPKKGKKYIYLKRKY